LAISVLCLASSVLGAGLIHEYFYNETPSEPPGQDTEPETGDSEPPGGFFSFIQDLFELLGGPTTISGTVNYLDDNVTLEDTSYTTGIYTISGTVERPDNSTYGTQTNPDITDPVISWDWLEINSTSGDNSINVTASGDENLSSCLLEINGTNVSMQGYDDTYFYYEWTPDSGNSSLQACCNDTANNTGCTGEAWYKLDSTAPVITWDWDDLNNTIAVDYTTVCVNLSETGNCTLDFNGTETANSTSGLRACWSKTSLSDGNYTANATCEDIYGNSADSTNAWIYVDTDVSITLAKSADVSSAEPGDGINWTITVNNTCESTLNVTVNDTNGESYNNDSLASGEIWTVSYATTAGCSSVTNTVTANASNGYVSYATTASDSVTVTHCGNGACDCSETCSSCAGDCGSCGGGDEDECDSDSDCDDDDACTEDSCDGGDCEHDAISCSDGNSCTDDSCDEDTGCEYTDNTDSCSDGDACTINDRCSGGSCEGAPKTCNDNDICTTDSCSGGNCVFAPNTLSCNDNDPCTTGDACSGGSCAGAQKDCSDGISCTTDSCIEGSCAHDASSCGCAQSGDCPEITCKSASCAANSCQYTDTTGSCDDGNACTENDVCSLGSCVGSEVSCDDSNICTDDSCDSVLGCVFTNNVAGCDDSNACTESDYCMNGACTSGEYTCACLEDSDCNDQNPCTSEVCSLGSCVYSDEGGSCDDGDRKTEGDSCAGGRCVPGTRVSSSCREDWECEEWGFCVDGLQSRVCECQCDDEEDCEGDNTTQRECGSSQQPILTLATIGIETNEGLKVGDILRIGLTDSEGNPITGMVILIRPDGTNITITGTEYVVDQAGVWRIIAKKEGYTDAETETVVKDAPKPQAQDISSQVSEAVQGVVEFFKEPMRFALLLVTVVGTAGLVVFFRMRKKSQLEKI